MAAIVEALADTAAGVFPAGGERWAGVIIWFVFTAALVTGALWLLS